ncbi:HlyD family efflux transporter periplasmic adaptor subunit [Rhizobium sp. CG4]|jgi:adhesin transport system membrane fusion protein|uniref:HlyD family efflux transporter periplasmic adaptor subunit n=1 Tax=Rhizobium sp. CG4 TaxID=2726075 RepID=UPI0020341E6A|nr:HlyD family efflux transporter periplasmic adaptor subunit [Rhizobium sp. CG4]MCM2457106.1 HlyD family efflux transporter periplasmic adaptor subunit [Rhizobium sp. CG4]
MATIGDRDFPGQGGWAFGDDDGRKLSRSTRVVQIFVLLLIAMLVWAYFATLDEVSSGDGRVVPTSREQVIQSLEGGILAKLLVREDQVVEPGQILAQLDPTRSESDVEETAAKYRAALAASARLDAEVNGTALAFSPALDAYPSLIAAETELYNARSQSLEQSLHWVEESLELVRSELKLNEELRVVGAASNVEVIRLRRQIVELELKKVEVRSEYLVRAREELAKMNGEVNSLSPVVTGRTDSLSRLTRRSPVRGIVKNIEVSTIGGVIPPNGKLMDIIPLGDELLVEARISPRDIAYIHPGQRASVKVSAYDYAIYGSLDGQVTTISPDTIQDEVDRTIYYYRVFIKTEKDALVNADGRELPIVPGMVATVDIHTGAKTVLEYLIKPFNKAREALRER